MSIEYITTHAVTPTLRYDHSVTDSAIHCVTTDVDEKLARNETPGLVRFNAYHSEQCESFCNLFIKVGDTYSMVFGHTLLRAVEAGVDIDAALEDAIKRLR